MLRTLMISLVAAVSSSASANADTAIMVKVTSIDGSATLTGQAIGWNEEKLVVRGSFGTTSLDRSRIICQGNGCPPRA